MLAGGQFDRVLGSSHALVHDGTLVEISALFALMPVEDVVRTYFAEVLKVVQCSSPFQVLAHVDFVGRYLPRWAGPYEDKLYESEYREVFAALAAAGRALEVNTKSRLTTVEQLSWWYEAGGEAVSFGSDAHEPWVVGDGVRGRGRDGRGGRVPSGQAPRGLVAPLAALTVAPRVDHWALVVALARRIPAVPAQ